MNWNFLRTSSFLQRAAPRCSQPVSSVVSPNTMVTPRGYILSKALPTVGFAPQPDVGSDSPHLVDTQSSCSGCSSRGHSVAHAHLFRPPVLDADHHHGGHVWIRPGADEGPEMQVEVGAELQAPVGMR